MKLLIDLAYIIEQEELNDYRFANMVNQFDTPRRRKCNLSQDQSVYRIEGMGGGGRSK